MRWRPFTWLLLSVFFFVAAAFFWGLGEQWAAKKARPPSTQTTNQTQPGKPKSRPVAAAMPFQLLSQPGNLNTLSIAPATNTNPETINRFTHRLSNTTKTIEQLQHSDKAILLENALIDTGTGARLPIPDHLRTHGEAGTYIVQSKIPLDDGFRAMVKAAGGEIVSYMPYIPNNAYLISAPASAIRTIAADAQVQTVIPWEPYFKLEQPLLKFAVEQQPLPEETGLNLLLFPGAREKTLAELKNLNAEIIREERSPFGPIVTVRASADASAVPALARLQGVQRIEFVRGRVPANDLSRAIIGVASNSVASNNYFGLTGSNVFINVNDTGIDPTHPDFAPVAGARIFGDSPLSLTDTDGHGTHVAGIIAGSGARSTNVNNALGSIMPAVDLQFRGKAPESKLFSIAFDPEDGPFVPDSYMQETAARTNAFISNNAWNYSGNAARNYDLAAASYDAAVRDALPRRPGSQPLLYVFPAGNIGAGNDSGLGGAPDTILSPATAKNVITVGGIELQRNVTNVVPVDCTTVSTTNGTNITICSSNTPWALMTDSSDQVASFSSRGNVGIGFEGGPGRFKPDVVAPATFVVSTRSGSWNEQLYYSRRTTRVVNNTSPVNPGVTLGTEVFIPENATLFSTRVIPISPVPFPGVAIFFDSDNFSLNPPWDFIGTNQLTVGLPALSPRDQGWFLGFNNSTTVPLKFDFRYDLSFSNANDNAYFQVLSNLNNSLETNGTTHYYRYESGTSLAAADASGTLALMQDFLQNRLGHQDAAGQFTNSPALLKAMLINGSRSVGDSYDFPSTNTINYQGWGLINLSNTLHGSLAQQGGETTSMFLYDQSPSRALATGQSHTRNFHLTEEGQGQPLRITLVWTDPPGNPAASIKLVNDLDIVVTNLDNNDVFFGNNFLAGNDFTLPWDTNGPPPAPDVVNNVENIYLFPPLSANYSVTVIGRHVNVNAVSAHPDNVVQDYALVVSSGNGVVTNALSLVSEADLSSNVRLVTEVTNAFGPDNPDNFGAILTGQHVGANSPLLGTATVPYPVGANGVITLGLPSQWHFYSFSNSTTFTNAAFSTFAPPNLSLPVMGTRTRQGEEGTNASRVEADIDLYVSRDPQLLDLSPQALANALKAVTRAGSETILLSNAIPGVYYVAVKAEDQRAAEYSLAAIISQSPFSETDENGNVTLRGIPAPAVIPDGKPILPGTATILAFAPDPTLRLRRVIVTNVLSHQLMGDLFGALTHQGDPTFAVLNNHSIDSAVTNAFFIYDDSQEHNVPGAQHTDGPGSLDDFAGKQSGQQWFLTMIDNAESHLGTNIALRIFLEKQQDLTNGITATLNAGACRRDFVFTPPDITTLTVTVAILSGSGPLSFEVCNLFDPTEPCRTNYVTSAGSVITLDRNDTPPVQGGGYFVRVCNLGNAPVTIRILAQIDVGEGVPVRREFTLTNTVPILDDAVTTVTNVITEHFNVSSLDVGLLIKHPRISDLAITLISPSGKRILLVEDRGALSTTGLGSFGEILNSQGLPVFAVTNMTPFYTNSFERALTGTYMPGAEFEDWNVLTNSVDVVRDLNLLCLNNNVLVPGDGVVSNSLPTTNSTSYRLSFNVTHSPYLPGMITWWPLDEDAIDIYGGFDGILCGDPQFVLGEVGGSIRSDGVASSMMVPRCPDLDVGTQPGFTIEGWITAANINTAGPLVEWNDITNTNSPGIGVQFWLSGRFTGAGGPGSLSAKLWDTNGQDHIIETPPFAVTNAPGTNGSPWEHVALTYDAATLTAKLYANGSLITSQPVSAGSFIPNTTGDLYLGYHAGPTAATSTSFRGGLDEFSLYRRALCDCEIAAIAGVTNRGKYGTNVLTCPVTNTVEIAGVLITNFVNGSNWFVTGPQWENNVIEFTHPLLTDTNGVGTNLASIVITPVGCPGSAFDEFVLSALQTNYFDGLLHFTDNTNLAPVAIKFASAPYTVNNFPPKLIFTNGFENAAQGLYQSDFSTGNFQTIPGSINNAAVGQHNWQVFFNPVAVIPSDTPGMSNAVAFGFSFLASTLPTLPGHRYQLTYTLRGPCAAGWWNGDIDPVSQRAQDLIGRNDGAFINGATNSSLRFVGPRSLFLPGMIEHSDLGLPDLAGKIELGDPANLRFTNSFTIEGWIRPIAQTNAYIISQIGVDEEKLIQQIFFRGDSRQCLDPYYLALEQTSASTFDLLFHVENANSGSCGVTLEAGGDLLTVGQWQHVAAVFESNVQWTNNPPWPTNQLRLYVDGVRVTNLTWHPTELFQVDGFTSEAPFADLDPGYSPGVAIGNRSRGQASEPFRGNIDELTVYSRALTDPEIFAIYLRNREGKSQAPPSQPIDQSLAKVEVLLDGEVRDVASGDNSKWTSHTFTFTALRRPNTFLLFNSVEPGTQLGGVSLTEIPSELNYQPEEPLSTLNGEDAFGEWRLEIWDTRVGATNTEPILANWQLVFHLLPDILPPVISLEHCVPYENTIPANSIQYFTVEVPQWATMATNSLLFARERFSVNPLPVTVFFDQNDFPGPGSIPLIGPLTNSDTVVVTSNTTPVLVPADRYFLAVTNPNPVAVNFSVQVCFDVQMLTNCETATNFVAATAGIPKYFQFDVPTNAVPPGSPPQEVTIWLSGARSNLTVVLSQSLPLPDLAHYDYISERPCTNDEVLLVLTNSTAFPIQSNHWYVGVFNSAATNVPFTITACYSTNYPVIIPLTNAIPYIADFTNQYVAPPGPPRWFFFEFSITNPVDGLLFELYDMSGDADLVLQKDVPPGQWPYFDASFMEGTNAEQIVVRPSFDFPDLRGNWYLGVYNNEATNVAYTIRATTTDTNGMLLSGLPLTVTLSPLLRGGLLQWNSVVGETYEIQLATTTFPPDWTGVARIVATTTCSTFQFPSGSSGFIRVIQVPPTDGLLPRLKIQLLRPDRVRISWPTAAAGFTLQYADSLTGPWTDLGLPVTVIGNELVVFDTIGPGPRFYRLVK
jgi:subtilisin-like proprotein convertase family protein